MGWTSPGLRLGLESLYSVQFPLCLRCVLFCHHLFSHERMRLLSSHWHMMIGILQTEWRVLWPPLQTPLTGESATLSSLSIKRTLFTWSVKSGNIQWLLCVAPLFLFLTLFLFFSFSLFPFHCACLCVSLTHDFSLCKCVRVSTCDGWLNKRTIGHWTLLWLMTGMQWPATVTWCPFSSYSFLLSFSFSLSRSPL